MLAGSPPLPPGGRILLVEDHPVTRQGMKALIEQQPGFAVCVEADSAAAALEIVREGKVTLAIVDISLRGENGLELVTELKALAADLPVLVVSMHDEELYAERARRAGAAGYVMKQHASDRILAALGRLLAGRTAFWDPLKRRTWSESPSRTGPENGIERLSTREREVLGFLGGGYSTREVAEKMGLSVKTIDTYRDHLKRKLDIPSAELLVSFAVRWSNSESRARDNVKRGGGEKS